MKWLRALSLAFTSALVAGCGDAGDPKAGRWVWLIHCSDCHGEKGVPLVPAAPNFARCEGSAKFDFQLIRTIRNGTETMPAARELLDDQDVRDVVAYLRGLCR